MLPGAHLASLLIAHEDDSPVAKKILHSVLTYQQRTEFLNFVRKIYINITNIVIYSFHVPLCIYILFS